jgi:UDP-N-acetylmuramate dehydrogenase
MNLERNFSLKKYNTFGLEVRAKYFVDIRSVEQAIKFFRENYSNSEHRLIIGGGSNVLFTENNYDGIVIKNSIIGIHVVKEDDHFFWVKSGAGTNWHKLVQSCVKANFGGIENLSLIPGTAGAAPIQNIGAYGVELKDTFEALEAIEVASGEKVYFRPEDCKFGYRDSVFKQEYKGKFFITNIVLKLWKEPKLNTSYGKVKEYLDALKKKEYSIVDVSEAIIKIRQSKLPDPAITGNAGSFFKNPTITDKKLRDIQKSFPEVPYFNLEDGHYKVPAAWLIDQCQLKGYKHQGASVHKDQPLVLINENNATGKDIWELSRYVQEHVKDLFNIYLEPEVSII